MRESLCEVILLKEFLESLSVFGRLAEISLEMLFSSALVRAVERQRFAGLVFSEEIPRLVAAVWIKKVVRTAHTNSLNKT
jgi:hypothetical protein